MADNYDERVVQLTLENKEFERNADKTTKSLEQLKQALKFESVGDSFDVITKSANRVNLNPISEGVQKVSNQFNLLTTIADTTFRNLTNRAIDAGERMIKSLSIDQVTAGWGKYAEQTGAVQTIMAATAQQFEDQAVQMEAVNTQLEKLTWFTDETSHKFTDMVSGIGKFTANNIDLETSVKAMEGIATWASLSGANTNEASRAIYNLAQAISVGSVKLIDWRSIENANMGTTEFKQTVIETAEAMGTLIKVSDDLWQTLDGKGTVSVANFSENLSKGWFTSDVLLKSLEQYGGFADRLQQFTEKTGVLTATAMNYIDDYVNGTLNMARATEAMGMSSEELIPWLEELGSAENDLGRRAFRAAQETKTFQEAIDYVKEAVSSGYATSFKYIFGDYLEAKEWWSEIAETMYDVFVVGGEIRNQILSLWKDEGGRDDFLDGIRELIDHIAGEGGLMDIVRTSFDEAFFGDDVLRSKADALLAFTKKFKEFAEAIKPTEETANNLSRILKSIFTILNNGIQVLRTTKRALEPIFDLLNRISGAVLEVIANISELISGRLDSFMQNRGLQFLYNTINDISKIINALATGSLNIVYALLVKIFDKIDHFWDVFDALGGGPQGMLLAIITVLEEFWESFQAGETIVNRTVDVVLGLFVGLYDSVKKLYFGIIDFFHLDKLDVSTQFENVPGMLQGISDTIASLNLEEKFNAIYNAVRTFVGGIRQLVIDLGDANSSIRQLIGSFTDEMMSWYNWMKNTIQGMDAESIAKVGILISMIYLVNQLGALTKSSSKLLNSISGTFKSISSVINQFAAPATMMDKLTGMFSQTKILQFGLTVTLLVKALNDLTKVDQQAVIQALITISLAMGMMVVVMKQFSKITKSLSEIEFKNKANVSLALLEIAGAVVLVVEAMAKIREAFNKDGSMDWIGLLGSFAAVAASLLALYEAAKLMSALDSSGLVAAAGSMSLMGIALITMVGPIVALGQMPLDKLANGVGAVGIMLLSMGAAAYAMQKTDWKSILAAAPAFTILSGAVLVLSGAIFALSEIKVEQLAASMESLVKGMTLLVASLVGLTYVADKMGAGNMMGVSLSFSLLTASLIPFAAAIKIMETIDWNKASGGITAMVSALAALVVIASLEKIFGLVGLTDAMVNVGAAMLEVGVGALAFAGAVALISGSIMALTLLAPAIGTFAMVLKDKFGVDMPTAVDEGFKVIERVIQDFLMMIPHLIPQVTMAVAAIITAINVAIWMKEHDTALTIISFVLTMIDVLVSTGPAIIEGLIKLFGILTDYVPDLLKAAGQFIKKLFAGLGVIVYEALIGLIQMVFNAIGMSGIGDYIADKMEAWAEGNTVAAINASAEAISQNAANLETGWYDVNYNAMQMAKKGIEEGNKDVKETAYDAGAEVAQEYNQGMIGKDGLDDPAEESTLIHDSITSLVGGGIINSTGEVAGIAYDSGAIVGDAYAGGFGDLVADGIGSALDGIMQAITGSTGGILGSTPKLVQGKQQKEYKKYQKQALSDVSKNRADRKMADILGIEYSEPEKKEIIEETEEFGFDLGTSLDSGVAKGVSGSGASKSAAKTKGEEIADAYSKAIASIDLSDKTDTLQYQLWEAMNPDADEAVKQQMKVKMLMEDIQSQADRVSAATDQYNQSLADLGAEAEETTKALQTLMEQQIKYYDLLQDLKEAQKTNTESTEDTGEIFRAISEEYHKMVTMMDGFGFSNEEIWNSIARQKGGEQYIIGAQKTTEAVNEMVDALDVSNRILSGEALDNLNKVSETVSNVAESFDESSEMLVASATALSYSMSDALGNSMIESFSGIGDAISESIIDSFRTLPDDISESVTTGFSNISSSISEPINADMKEAMTNTGFVVCDSLGYSIDENSEIPISQTEEMSQGLIDISKEVLGISGTSNSAVFEGIGENITEGLRLAIEAGESAVVTSIIKMIESAIAAAKQAAAIHSPSAEMAYVGEMMDLGVVQGTEKYSYLVRQGAAQVITDSIEEATKAASASDIIGKYVKDSLGGETVTITLDVDTTELDATIAQYQAASNLYYSKKKELDRRMESDNLRDKNIYGLTSQGWGDDEFGDISVYQAQMRDIYSQTMAVVSRQLEVAKHLASMEALNKDIQEQYNTSDVNITFNQTNTSPQPLSRLDIYRDTKKQLDSFYSSMNSQTIRKGLKL